MGSQLLEQFTSTSVIVEIIRHRSFVSALIVEGPTESCPVMRAEQEHRRVLQLEMCLKMSLSVARFWCSPAAGWWNTFSGAQMCRECQLQIVWMSDDGDKPQKTGLTVFLCAAWQCDTD